MPEIRVHRVTKYDPADRNEYGHYTGPLDSGIVHFGPGRELDGRLAACWIHLDEPEDTAADLAGVRRLAVVPDEPGPIPDAVLPDPDGVVRVRGDE